MNLCIKCGNYRFMESKHGSKHRPSSVPTFTYFPESKYEGLRREMDVG